MGGILRRESRHMPIEASLALPNYAGDLSQASLREYQARPYINYMETDSLGRIIDNPGGFLFMLSFLLIRTAFSHTRFVHKF